MVAVAAVNVAGIWDIALARRAAEEEAVRTFASETAVRARSLEQTLSDLQSNLTFLAASSSIARLTRAADTAEAVALREAAESALLVSLRSHAAIVRLAVVSPEGMPLLLVGRRGGLPVLWVSGVPTGQEGAATDPERPRLVASLPDRASSSNRLEVEVAPALLLGRAEPEEHRCRLTDARGKNVARHPGQGPGDAEPRIEASSTLKAEGWSAPGPWTLACAEPERLAVAFTEPRAARQRTTLALNLGGMALAVLLGWLALREVRQRERVEAAAHEEARVRDLERQLFHAERLTTVGQL
ncbi:MAG TPA: hypothetical protein VFQ51_18775, partial [Vicinamibacteria bacterium]|nr:hypothetical protein [Vicinamibacteria bacterium]